MFGDLRERGHLVERANVSTKSCERPVCVRSDWNVSVSHRATIVDVCRRSGPRNLSNEAAGTSATQIPGSRFADQFVSAYR